ncbi:hypothetical protein C211_14946 [Stutzerimonas degradans]|nr:hypothetical protein C211_14946 [Stutzerimonas degradans]
MDELLLVVFDDPAALLSLHGSRESSRTSSTARPVRRNTGASPPFMDCAAAKAFPLRHQQAASGADTMLAHCHTSVMKLA